jgi:hypothetical protein
MNKYELSWALKCCRTCSFLYTMGWCSKHQIKVDNYNVCNDGYEAKKSK